MPSFVRTSLVLFAVLPLGSALAQQSMTPVDVPAAAAANATTPAIVEPGGSGVRIVRLSEVRGVVRLDRNTGRGFETAFANIPVVGGARLMTGQGVAEVEFEDNSSLRLAPETEVEFTELSRTASGSTVTTVGVLKGMAYVSLEKTKGNVFTLGEANAKVALMPGAHVRLDARKPQLAVAVLDGEAAVSLGAATTMVSKHETLELNPELGTMATVARGTEEQDFDQWDKQERDYHRQKASLAGTGGMGLYGANDLNYYGSFSDVAGCGNVWRPYFANAAWSPFASGVWAYYPNAGYSWVSPYPWGWLPYHSGTWMSCGASGWGWQPGGSWYGVNNIAALRLPGHQLPHPVPPAPVRTAPTLVPVNMTAVTASGAASGDRFMFRQNSAGLGVPRAEFGNLRGMSSHVDRHGVVASGWTGGSSMPSAAVGTSLRGPGEVRMPAPGRTTGTSMGASAGHTNYGGGGMRGGSMSTSSSMSTATAPAASAGATAGARH